MVVSPLPNSLGPLLGSGLLSWMNGFQGLKRSYPSTFFFSYVIFFYRAPIPVELRPATALPCLRTSLCCSYSTNNSRNNKYNARVPLLTFPQIGFPLVTPPESAPRRFLRGDVLVLRLFLCLPFYEVSKVKNGSRDFFNTL